MSPDESASKWAVPESGSVGIDGDTVDPDSMLQWVERLDLVETLDRARRFSPD